VPGPASIRWSPTCSVSTPDMTKMASSSRLWTCRPWSRSVCRHPGLPEGDQPSGVVATRQHGPRLRLVYSNKGEGFEGSHLRLSGLHPPPSPQPAASPWIERQGSDGCLADPPRPGHLRRIHAGSWLESQPVSEVGFANSRRAADQGSTFLIARRHRQGVATA
jgi:hypothetical protein